jgi:hypothetical protein
MNEGCLATITHGVYSAMPCSLYKNGHIHPFVFQYDLWIRRIGVAE